MRMLRRIPTLIPGVLFIAFAFGSLLLEALAMPRAEVGVISGAGDRIIPQSTLSSIPNDTESSSPKGTGSSTTAPSPASPVKASATPPSAGQPWGTVAGLRRQGFRPAILLAGDLLLLIVALIIVIIDRCRRPR